ncbi:MAG: acyl-CoA dehydrogenase family protein [Lentisphaeria bacterium]|nr:acyl-CoA dehydrogenase family protein [Candidatus Neomarinimicrobiota bacterium]MCF7841609.1 acyl-CoA dehydrogenase family protein [Lentisphaeria bacterium]
MHKGGKFLTIPITEEEIFTREKFTEEQHDFFNMVKDFAESTIAPITDEIDKLDEALSRKLMGEMGAMGMLGIDIPEAYGGMEMDKATASLVGEALTYGKNASIVVTYSDQTGIAMLPILWYGNDAQKEKYLPKLVTGEWIGSYALTEPGSGSDALAVKTTAKLNEAGTHYILNGVKQYITNGSWADVGVVFANAEGEKFTAFILDKDCKGWNRGPEEKKLGIKGSSTTTYVLEDCEVPVENVLGEVGKGAAIAFNVLYVGRYKLGAVTLGGAKSVIKVALQYAKERKQFGQPIADFGMLQRKFADMVVRAYEADTIVYHTAGSMDEAIGDGKPDSSAYFTHLQKAIEDHAIETSASKIICSETLWLNVDDGLQVFGGYGYSEEYPLAKMYRDERINRIFEGTNEINRLIIAGTVLKNALMESLPLRTEADRVRKQWLPDLAYDQAGDFSTEFKVAELSRSLLLHAFDACLLKYGQDFKNRQWVMEPIADMAIAFMTLQGVLRRQLQLPEGYGKREIANTIARISIAKRFSEISELVRVIWGHTLSHEERQAAEVRLHEHVNQIGFFPDTIAHKAAVVEALYEAGEYFMND